MWFWRIVTVGVWVGAMGTSFAIGTVVAGWSPSPLVIAAQGVLPLVTFVAMVVAVVGLVRRLWIPCVAAVVATLVGSGLVLAAVRPSGTPAWAEGSPVLTVFASNVLMSNPDPAAALEVAMRSDADVVVFSELSPRFEPALRRSGLLDRYPTLVRAGSGNVLMTRLPSVDEGVERRNGTSMPTVTVRVGGRDVLVVGVHTLAPHAVDSVGEWSGDYEAVAQAAPEGSDVVAIGDFNGGPWNGPFRRLLDWGFVDAHSALGHGLSRTWGPRYLGLDGRIRVLGIDHSVSRGALAPVAVTDVNVPGSDHRAIEVTYAVR